MKSILFVILFIPSLSFADGWFCEDDAGKRDGNIIYSCGMGDDLDEAGARLKALKDALTQFDLICEASSDCYSRHRTVEPKRTSCHRDPRGFITCARLIVVTLGR